MISLELATVTTLILVVTFALVGYLAGLLLAKDASLRIYDECPKTKDNRHWFVSGVCVRCGRARHPLVTEGEDIYRNIDAIADRHFIWVGKMGWNKDKRPLEYIGLLASEIGECSNECRQLNPTDKLGEELADVVLRSLNIMKVYGFVPSAEITRKMVKNRNNGTRGRLK